MANFNKRVFESTGRHLVTLSCVQRVPGDTKEYLQLISGFIVELFAQWLFVTAGHVLKEVQAAIDGGAEFDVWRFSDYTAGGEYRNIGIPMSFDIQEWFFIYDAEKGFDFAVYPLSELYRLNLEAGGVVPIPHGAWRSEQIESAYWAVIGVPYESVVYDGETIIKARAVMVALEPISNEEAPGKAIPHKFCARLHEGSEAVVNDVKGMSGSPIFALRKADSDWQYVVIGVQSGWWESSRIVTACSISFFMRALEDAITEAKEQ
jgi:hypothetical protein